MSKSQISRQYTFQINPKPEIYESPFNYEYYDVEIAGGLIQLPNFAYYFNRVFDTEEDKNILWRFEPSNSQTWPLENKYYLTLSSNKIVSGEKEIERRNIFSKYDIVEKIREINNNNKNCVIKIFKPYGNEDYYFKDGSRYMPVRYPAAIFEEGSDEPIAYLSDFTISFRKEKDSYPEGKLINVGIRNINNYLTNEKLTLVESDEGNLKLEYELEPQFFWDEESRIIQPLIDHYYLVSSSPLARYENKKIAGVSLPLLEVANRIESKRNQLAHEILTILNTKDEQNNKISKLLDKAKEIFNAQERSQNILHNEINTILETNDSEIIKFLKISHKVQEILEGVKGGEYDIGQEILTILNTQDEQNNKILNITNKAKETLGNEKCLIGVQNFLQTFL
ncbi:hypothetical protein [Wolbachia endosymbiont of Tetranychus urticae]|uniref:hypothetical protein n=1 Tax=Wolbachia endosymbiont of Tetranychus urticae TaxID=169184 RepID=UPI00397D90FE